MSRERFESIEGGRPSRRRGATSFLVAVFATTWLFQLPALLAQRGLVAGPSERFAPLVVLGFFAPAIFAFLFAVREDGARGARALFAGLRVFGVGVGWYVVALGASPVILLVGTVGYRLVTGAAPGAWWYPPAGAQGVAALLVVPFMEQIPWRAYAFPRLERRLGTLNASLVVGVAWSLFHLQKHLLLGSAAAFGSAAVMVPFMTAGTVVFTWIQKRTRGSVLLVVIAHMGIFLDNSSLALPANATPLVIHAVGFCAAALSLVVLDGGAFRATRLDR